MIHLECLYLCQFLISQVFYLRIGQSQTLQEDYQTYFENTSITTGKKFTPSSSLATSCTKLNQLPINYKFLKHTPRFFEASSREFV